MGESTEMDNSPATSLKMCQKSLSTERAAVGNEKVLLPERRAPCFPGEVAPGQGSHPEENGRIGFTDEGPGERKDCK